VVGILKPLAFLFRSNCKPLKPISEVTHQYVILSYLSCFSKAIKMNACLIAFQLLFTDLSQIPIPHVFLFLFLFFFWLVSITWQARARGFGGFFQQSKWGEEDT
jgi:hypothetical protein